MLYSEILDKYSFYKKFTPSTKLKCYEFQSKIIITSILLNMLEDVLLKSPDDLKKIKLEITKSLDGILFSDSEIMSCARIFGTEEYNPFSWMAVSRNVIRLKNINKAISEGSLKSALSDFENLLYVTYVNPLSVSDNESYFKRFIMESLKYKEIFLSDYVDITGKIRAGLVA